MSDRTTSGYLFGGLASSRGAAVHIADGVWQGGLSGVAFTEDVALVSRVTQGCQPVGPTREVTACERNIIVELDGQPALPSLLADLGLPALDDPRQALPRLRATLVGVTGSATAPVAPAGAAATQSRHRAFGDDVRVRHLIGLDPGRRAVAVAELLQPGMRVAFCQRDVAAARRDLVRICSEIRDELDSARRAGAAHPGCAVRQLRRPWRAAFRRPFGGIEDRAARLGRGAAGRLLCRRRDRAPAPVRLYGGADGLHRAGLNAGRQSTQDAAALLFRRATRDDLPAIVAMLADDPLGARRESNTSPLPRCYHDAFDAIDRDPNIELVVVRGRRTTARWACWAVLRS